MKTFCMLELAFFKTRMISFVISRVSNIHAETPSWLSHKIRLIRKNLLNYKHSLAFS